MRLLGAVALASIVGFSTLAFGQAITPGQPARPVRPGEAPPKGAAGVKGQVVAAGSGSPVRRAQVRAMSMEGRGGGITSTDNEGRFEIKDLPAGRFTVTASKGGFIMGQFGHIKTLPPSDDYMVVAVQNLEPGQGGDPEFLARALDEAKRVTLAEGETKAFDIKLSKLVP